MSAHETDPLAEQAHSQNSAQMPATTVSNTGDVFTSGNAQNATQSDGLGEKNIIEQKLEEQVGKEQKDAAIFHGGGVGPTPNTGGKFA